MKPLILFFKKQIAVEEKIQRMLRYLQDMNHLYREAYQTYLEGNHEKFFQQNNELGKIEHDLDDIGLQIQMALLHESLMPDSRDDLLWLLTKLDKVPSRFKHSLADLALEKPEIPADFHAPLRKMLLYTHNAVQVLAHATDALFSDLRAVRQHVEEVGRQESEVDQVERQLLEMVFSNQELELARQYQLKGILKALGGVTNLAEDVADAVLILATKHTA